MAAFGLSIGGTNAAVGVLRVSPQREKGRREKGQRAARRTMCEAMFLLSLYFSLRAENQAACASGTV